MPRRARKHAISGIYHVMLRGINCQQILEDKEDNLKFMQILKECKLKCGYKILAYCLMGNHIHILIKEESMPLGEVISVSVFVLYIGTIQNTKGLGIYFRTGLKARQWMMRRICLQ